MKISEMITRLGKIKDEVGDLEVQCFGYDGQIKTKNLCDVVVCDTEIVRWNAESQDWDRKPVSPYVIVDCE